MIEGRILSSFIIFTVFILGILRESSFEQRSLSLRFLSSILLARANSKKKFNYLTLIARIYLCLALWLKPNICHRLA